MHVIGIYNLSKEKGEAWIKSTNFACIIWTEKFSKIQFKLFWLLNEDFNTFYTRLIIVTKMIPS